MEIDSKTFRKTLGKFASGVTVITTLVDGETHGMTASAFFSLSLDPPLVAVAVDHRARIHELLLRSGRFGVSVLNRQQESLSNHFARMTKEEVDVSFFEEDGVPLIGEALMNLVCRVADSFPGGDHTIYVGQVEWCRSRDDGEPLMYYAGGYHSIAT